MDLNDMKGAVILLGLIALIGAAVGIALSGFGANLTASSAEKNITTYGLTGLLNVTGYLGTIGTIIGVSVLIGIVILAFSFANR